MPSMRVRHEEGDRFAVVIRDHVLHVDQPRDVGGTDAGPTPTELFVAGLAACVGHYARGWLSRHEYDERGLAVDVDWAFAKDRPVRVGSIDVRLHAPGVPAERRPGLLAVATHCTVHNSLTVPPEVHVYVADDHLAAVAPHEAA
jgi:uncharacterized OsmC-like protein